MGQTRRSIVTRKLPFERLVDELEPTADPHASRVLALADQNPRAVADVVQTWMREEN